MDQLPPFGKIIGQVVGPTNQVYMPLLAKNATEIESTSRVTHSYGSHPRHQLDIYTPSSSAPSDDSGSRPLLVFLYGGGFSNGDKTNEARPLVYQNLGHFFADKVGLETIVIDYRLIKHGAKFPSGGEDLDEALRWISQEHYAGQNRDVYVMGNSAGAINVCTWLFEPAFRPSRARLMHAGAGVRLCGIILLSGLYHFKDSSPVLRQLQMAYFGDQLDDCSSLASLARCEASGELSAAAAPASWPRLLLIDAELDPDDILTTGQELLERARKSAVFKVVDHLKVPGHNHISPPLALGTGITAEEDWGYKLGTWVTKNQ